MKAPTRLAIFASGNGSNAQRLVEYFSGPDIVVSAIYCNNPKAFVIERANSLNLPVVVFNRETFYKTNEILVDLKSRDIDWIVLAGFLWLIPESVLNAFPQRIINIHPALLPDYGGKGMYGMKVHESVVASGDKQSGITIHYVNDKYDDGDIIFRATCTVDKADMPEKLAAKIHELEYEHYPKVVEKLVTGCFKC